MPGRLTVCGCVTLPIGSDDLAIPAMVGIFFRAIATVAAAILIAVGETQNSCATQIADVVFLALTLAICTVTSVLYIVLYRVTNEGNMLQWEKRNRRTVPVFHALAVSYCLEVGLAVFGVILVATTPCAVPSELYIIELLIVVAIFVDFSILGFVLGILIYVTGGKKPKPLEETSYKQFTAGALKTLSYLCCGLFGRLESPMGNQELAWSEISRMIHSFLKDLLMDLTVMDIFTAFVLLRAEQRANEASRVSKALSSPGVTTPKSPNIRFKSQSVTSSTPITGADTRAMEAMKEFDEFAPYMLGIYGWKLALYMNPFRSLCLIPVNLVRKMIYGNVVEHHVFKSIIGADSKKRQIIYSSFTSYLGEAVPYTITVDHERRAVVITLRGTMSVGDIATDLLCTPARLDLASRQWGVKDGEKHFAHSGMLAVANRIRTDIEKQQILHRLMRVPTETEDEQRARESVTTAETISQDDRESFLKAMGKSKNAELPDGLMYATEVFVGARELENMDCSKYRLICCGHSLGSCMAAILSLLLRPRFPQVRCLAYSCVSAIFSRELAEESQEWITSCTVGKDIFGRGSWYSAKKLRDQLIDAIRRSKASKATILLSLLRRGVPINQLMYSPDEVPDDLERQELAAHIARLKKVEDHLLDQTPMFMPGRIMYFEKTHTEVRRKTIFKVAKSTYTPTWINDRAQIQDIQISSRLILDHMPDYLMRVLRDAMEHELTDHFNAQKRLISSTGDSPLHPPRDLEV